MTKSIHWIQAAAFAAIVVAVPAQAQELGGTVSIEQPAVALIMPFDVTEGRQRSHRSPLERRPRPDRDHPLLDAVA